MIVMLSGLINNFSTDALFFSTNCLSYNQVCFSLLRYVTNKTLIVKGKAVFGKVGAHQLP